MCAHKDGGSVHSCEPTDFQPTPLYEANTSLRGEDGRDSLLQGNRCSSKELPLLPVLNASTRTRVNSRKNPVGDVQGLIREEIHSISKGLQN